MFNRYLGAVAVLLLFASMSSEQADQAANAEKQKAANGQQKDAPQKENAGDAIAAIVHGLHDLDAKILDRHFGHVGRSVEEVGLISDH